VKVKNFSRSFYKKNFDFFLQTEISYLINIVTFSGLIEKSLLICPSKKN